MKKYCTHKYFRHDLPKFVITYYTNTNFFKHKEVYSIKEVFDIVKLQDEGVRVRVLNTANPGKEELYTHDGKGHIVQASRYSVYYTSHADKGYNSYIKDVVSFSDVLNIIKNTNNENILIVDNLKPKRAIIKWRKKEHGKDWDIALKETNKTVAQWLKEHVQSTKPRSRPSKKVSKKKTPEKQPAPPRLLPEQKKLHELQEKLKLKSLFDISKLLVLIRENPSSSVDGLIKKWREYQETNRKELEKASRAYSPPETGTMCSRCGHRLKEKKNVRSDEGFYSSMGRGAGAMQSSQGGQFEPCSNPQCSGNPNHLMNKLFKK
jgi:hypothetical protein